VIKQIFSNYRGISIFQIRTKFYPTYCCQGCSICRGNYWGPSVWMSTWRVNY